jgi:ATP-dependent Lon protease
MDDIQRISKGDEIITIPTSLPLIPVRELVIFPYSVVPLLIGRPKSLVAIKQATEHDNLIMIATQKAEDEIVRTKDIFRIGTVCKILQHLDFAGEQAKVVVEGIIRAKITRFTKSSDYFRVKIDVFDEDVDVDAIDKKYFEQLMYYFKEYASLAPELPPEIVAMVERQGDPYRMVDFIALNVNADPEAKQRILAEPDFQKRIKLLLKLLQIVIGQNRVRMDLDRRVQENLMRNQRNFYIQEKLKIINDELGEEEDNGSPEISRLEKAILKAKMPKTALEKALEELAKLKRIPTYSPEYTVISNFLDWMVQVPWVKRTTDHIEISNAKKILDDDHYGLEKPKARILEHLAVLKRVKHLKGPILCLVGPPGVGKTSLGRSIAKALGRNFTRISLGGVRDEAEIRGHRRTYIGAMPGKFIQAMKKVGTINPLILLDEVDKMSNDFRGDPASALLEVLDPEQNNTFTDHYLDVEYDLSKVFFITTANSRDNIPLPLQDRMEIIEIPGYMEHEKVQIAHRHLIPKQMKAHGLKKKELVLPDETIIALIRGYTREAGVRELERQIGAICRKKVRMHSENNVSISNKISPDDLLKILGKPKYFNRESDLVDQIGIATGLAWTAFGGEILKIEAIVLPGKGKLILTGKLGDVMKESANIALSHIRFISDKYQIDPTVFDKNDVHIHLPEGAIPKDGPSAGAALAAAILSALTGRKLRNNIALTGELTLYGNILAVGGLNEKLLAAQRNHILTVLVPAENHKEIADLPNEIRRGLTINEVSTFEEVLKILLI